MPNIKITKMQTFDLDNKSKVVLLVVLGIKQVGSEV